MTTATAQQLLDLFRAGAKLGALMKEAALAAGLGPNENQNMVLDIDYIEDRPTLHRLTWTLSPEHKMEVIGEWPSHEGAEAWADSVYAIACEIQGATPNGTEVISREGSPESQLKN